MIVEYKGVCNVQYNFNYYFDMFTNKAANIFKFKNLPDTVDERFLNLSLILNGKVCFTKFNDKLYALTGNIGGEPNAYYEPTEFIIANPILGSKKVKIRQLDGSSSLEGLDGILMGNTDTDLIEDKPHSSLFNLIYQYAGLLADNISSLNCSQINGRVSQLWTADNDVMARTAEQVLQQVYAGKPYKLLTQNILDKIGVLSTAASGQSNTLLNLMEIHQFFLSQFYSELGIISNYNMKRERINTAETEMGRGCLDLNIDNMWKNRKEAVEQINELFGTSIEVELNPEIFYKETGNASLGQEELIQDDVLNEDQNGVPEDTVDNPEPEVSEEKSEDDDSEDDDNKGDAE